MYSEHVDFVLYSIIFMCQIQIASIAILKCTEIFHIYFCLSYCSM